MTLAPTPRPALDPEPLADLARTLEVMLAERVTPASEDAVGTLRHEAQTRSLLAALARVQDGSYGWCRTCDGRIPVARLEIVPTALACASCASADH